MRRSNLLITGILVLMIFSACNPIEEERTVTPSLKVRASDTATITKIANNFQHNDCSNGYIALTFDDGPFAIQTNELITVLEKAHLRGTFFDLGSHVAGNSSLVMAQFKNGWIGNHSWSHSDMLQLAEEQIMTELADTQKALQAITRQAPILFRPPYLKSNFTLKNVEGRLGLTEVMTTVDSKDWAGVSADEIVSNVSIARSGDVVLMHDNLATTRDAIPKIADFMTKQELCPGKIDPTTGRAVAP
jgi:peptidoglycan/xylan/chitin deacetylase (PgdA/CDA1 family)